MSRRRMVYQGQQLISDTEYDVSWDMVRERRDNLLRASDWRAVKDRVLPNEWKEYRQALRDITDHDSANDAYDNWPEAPE